MTHDEAHSASRADALARRVVQLRNDLGRTVAIGISGVDCAGKSTLAEALRRRLVRQGVATFVIAGDEFTRPTNSRYQEKDEGLGYYRDSFDYSDLFERVLPAVRSQQVRELQLRVSDWDLDGWQEQRLMLEPNGVVIVEGCFLFIGGREAAFDLSIWIDLPLDRVVERALSRPRDLARMGGPDGVRERYERRYLPGQELHLQRDDPAGRATLVIPSDAD